MRDIASCFSDYAVQVSDTSCSSHSSSSCISPGGLDTLIPSIQNSVTCLYRTVLPDTQKLIFITLTWCRNTLQQGLTIAFDDDPAAAVKLGTNSRLFRKLKGTKTVDFQGTAMELSWDLSTARYGSGPEPLDGYYVSVAVESEPCLVLGDLPVRKGVSGKHGSRPTGKFKLISRQEHFSGRATYSTRARFSDAGGSHDIAITCGGNDGDDGLNNPVLSVCIDKKVVIRVKRLQWNFRGNQTIFLDGLLVDMMWDVHDWFYVSGPGRAVFMFRTRSRVDSSRLWMEEKLVQKDQDKGEFSLTIYASKNSPK